MGLANRGEGSSPTLCFHIPTGLKGPVTLPGPTVGWGLSGQGTALAEALWPWKRPAPGISLATGSQT